MFLELSFLRTARISPNPHSMMSTKPYTMLVSIEDELTLSCFVLATEASSSCCCCELENYHFGGKVVQKCSESLHEVLGLVETVPKLAHSVASPPEAVV